MKEYSNSLVNNFDLAAQAYAIRNDKRSRNNYLEAKNKLKKHIVDLEEIAIENKEKADRLSAKYGA